MRSLSDQAPLSVELPDGPNVLLRPLVRDDVARVRRAYAMLSPESRMHRFWEKPSELSDSRAESLADTDGIDHIAWIAIPPVDERLPGYAGASFWRDPEAPERAELAFTVADAWQRRGFGTLLFSVLWLEGWRVGIRTFFGFCRPVNTGMIEWWRSVGGNAVAGPRQVELELPLEAPGRFLERVAYEMPPSPRRVEIAEWLRSWLDREEED